MAVHSSIASKFSLSCAALLTGKQPWLEGANKYYYSSDDGTAADPHGPAQEKHEPAGAMSSSSSFTPGSSANALLAKRRERWFADLLCLPVEPSALREPLTATVPIRVLLDEEPGSKGEQIRTNIRHLWQYSLKAWNDRDEARHHNALQILVYLSDIVLSKSLSALSIISILCSSVTNADADLLALVETIRLSLQRCCPRSSPKFISDGSDTDERRAELLLTLKLIIVWTARAGQTSLSSAFFRRDLFPSLSAVLSAVSTSTFEPNTLKPGRENGAEYITPSPPWLREVKIKTSLCLTLLCTSSLPLTRRLGEIEYDAVFSGNPYARRLADWVDVASMSAGICEASAEVWEQGVIAAYEQRGEQETQHASGLSSLWGLGAIFSRQSNVPAVDGVPAGKSNGRACETKTLPAPSVCTLLPILLLSHLNGAFVGALTNGKADGGLASASTGGVPTLPSIAPHLSLLSMSTFLHANAAADARSAACARLSLATLLSLVQCARAESLLRPLETHELQRMRICLHRHTGGIVPASSMALATSIFKRAVAAPPQTSMHYILLNASIFLRNNLSRRLNGEGYLLALRLVSHALALLATTRTMLDLDWSAHWHALLSFASFLASRIGELEAQYQDAARRAGKQLLCTLSAALLESDRFLPSPKEVHQLIYEVVRSGAMLRRLAAALVPHLVAGSSPTDARAPPSSAGETNSDSGPLTPMPVTPTPHSAASFLSFTDFLASSPPLPQKAYVELPGWKVLELVIKTVEAKLQQQGDANSSAVGPADPPVASGLSVKTVLSAIAKLNLDVLLAGASVEELRVEDGSGRRLAGMDADKSGRRTGRYYGGGSNGDVSTGSQHNEYLSANSSAAPSRTASPAPSFGDGYASAGSGGNSSGAHTGLLAVVKLCAADALTL
ncbi:hypothetical protein K437DRAFT_258455 [Tilletiaria anomala UBC 951]|uniref:Armadillo-like helical domain-containing protein n=1 Tax=Tilletiaria anomala (strain ATCC 24038 / CBS 436.72 / UBC 951) TaxID=1037660 RepID=A0A066VHK2_TILAU|nr:uncharacterized protein K437DRAFT_258455 [Tilletiaria anomala UBC 951]KDN40956.1 hypothetical protein K437DRAFT_258455 [Tilletiaria anomala UBC 951]